MAAPLPESSLDLQDLFSKIIGEENVISDEEGCSRYGTDETEHLFFPPQIVLRPRTATEVSAIMKLCNDLRIPVTPRGGGTGLMGGALPNRGGVVISLARMNSILNIDEENLQVTVEPGVITEVLQEAVRQKGFFYPPDPSSRGSCFIGGNIATNCGGPRAVKYGVVKDYVLNLQMVLADGSVLWTGANVLKNSTGYHLTQLVVGSEGTLGIVTQIVLKLLPHPRHELLMLVPFNKLEDAGAAVSAIFRAGFSPSALELMEINALRIVERYVESAVVKVAPGTEAHLIIETDGNDEEMLMKEMEGIASLLAEYNCGEIAFAESAAQKAELWKLRRRVAEAVKVDGFTIEEDTVVPRAALPALIRGVKQLAEEHHFSVVCYGHAGDGNMHIRIKFPGHENSYENNVVQPVLEALFRLVKSLGGTISGEHGIGLIQKPFMDIVVDAPAMELMRGIKKVFDPNNILNAGKIFD